MVRRPCAGPTPPRIAPCGCVAVGGRAAPGGPRQVQEEHRCRRTGSSPTQNASNAASKTATGSSAQPENCCHPTGGAVDPRACQHQSRPLQPPQPVDPELRGSPSRDHPDARRGVPGLARAESRRHEGPESDLHPRTHEGEAAPRRGRGDRREARLLPLRPGDRQVISCSVRRCRRRPSREIRCLPVFRLCCSSARQRHGGGKAVVCAVVAEPAPVGRRLQRRSRARLAGTPREQKRDDQMPRMPHPVPTRVNLADRRLGVAYALRRVLIGPALRSTAIAEERMGRRSRSRSFRPTRCPRWPTAPRR
jgi:hypothetical protein